jgi:histidinol phosphatase-like enzyme
LLPCNIGIEGSTKEPLECYFVMIKEWGISKNKSFMIADKETDKMCAKRAGIKFFYKKNNSLYKQIKKII